MLMLMIDWLLLSWGISRENLALGYQDSKASPAFQAFLAHLERRAASADQAFLESMDWLAPRDSRGSEVMLQTVSGYLFHFVSPEHLLWAQSTLIGWVGGWETLGEQFCVCVGCTDGGAYGMEYILASN